MTSTRPLAVVVPVPESVISPWAVTPSAATLAPIALRLPADSRVPIVIFPGRGKTQTTATGQHDIAAASRRPGEIDTGNDGVGFDARPEMSTLLPPKI